MSNRINSKAKGSKGERSASHALEEWTGIPFARVPQSGGLRWQGGQNVTGDIIPEDVYELQGFPFSIEVKLRKALDFEDLLLPNNSDIWKFWEQAKGDAARVNKIPMLMMRRDRMPKHSFYIGIPKKHFRRIRKVMPNIKYMNIEDEFVLFFSADLFRVPYTTILKLVLWRI